MMLSKCSLHTIARFSYRLKPCSSNFVSWTVKKTIIESVCSSKRELCYGNDLNLTTKNIRLFRCYSSDVVSPPPRMDDDNKSQNIFQRFKTMAKNYWYIVLPVHLVTSTVWFGSFYLIASSGIDVPALLDSLHFPEWIIEKVRNGNSWTSYLVIAYGLYKICTPLRYMVTLGGTSLTIRYMRKLGYTIKNTNGPNNK